LRNAAINAAALNPDVSPLDFLLGEGPQRFARTAHKSRPTGGSIRSREGRNGSFERSSSERGAD